MFIYVNFKNTNEGHVFPSSSGSVYSCAKCWCESIANWFSCYHTAGLPKKVASLLSMKVFKQLTPFFKRNTSFLASLSASTNNQISVRNHVVPTRRKVSKSVNVWVRAKLENKFKCALTSAVNEWAWERDVWRSLSENSKIKFPKISTNFPSNKKNN